MLQSINQSQGSADKAADGMLNRSGAVGTEALMGVLKNYCRSLNLKTAITVGVIGYPNVGKSSLINSLKRCVTACGCGEGARGSYDSVVSSCFASCIHLFLPIFFFPVVVVC